ncbi:TolC family protein [Neptunomonas marina]|uniref:TolC family protein n=1 Tax=Neptunomonas marina TaxID=1815562 RepID=A0A437Q977_9GAMM|nr:TolC family protein [Neptunomonas marina]RVU31026.1 TolC family protein [Neptunomonas marina]
MSKTKLSAVIATALLVAGCATTSPRHAIPEVDYPAIEVISERLANQAELPNTGAHWWQAMGDPALDQLVERALAANHDLRAAALRVDAQLERLRVSRDQYRPQGGVAAQASSSRQQPLGGGDAQRTEQLSAGLSADWQLDLFGRISARVRQAQASTNNAQAAKAQVLADVVSGVASAYSGLAGAEEQLAVLDQQLKLLDESVDVLQFRVDEGLATSLELSRAKALQYEFRAQKPALVQQQNRYRETLAVLTGSRIQGIVTGQTAGLLASANSMSWAIDKPVVALVKAPAVLLATSNVANAFALTDEAQASLYPQVSITGVLGVLNGGGLSLGDAQGQRLVQPTLRWSLLNFAALKANLRAAKLEEQVVLEAYEKQWLTVLNRADTAISQWQSQQQRLALLVNRQRFAQEAHTQAKSRYEEGIIPYLDYLDAQRDLLSSESELVVARTQLLARYTELRRAFAGDWANTLYDA